MQMDHCYGHDDVNCACLQVFSNSKPFIFKELAASTPSVHNWKGMIIALVVISQVIGLVLLAVHLMTPHNALLELDGERMQREDIMGKEFKNKMCNGIWISGIRVING